MEFKISDLVVLKSGSPVMTIVSFRSASQSGRVILGAKSVDVPSKKVKVKCEWWDSTTNSFQQREFDESALDRYIAIFFV